MQIHLFLADHANENLITKFGDYPVLFSNRFQKVLEKPEIVVHAICDNQFPENLDTVDNVVITGSKYSCFEEDIDWVPKLKKTIIELDKRKKNIFGVCFGHQIIALALGGKAQRSERGWGVGLHSYQVEDTSIFPCETIDVYVSHQDQVVQMPLGARRILTSDFCPIAGYRIDNHIMTIQGHPEFTVEYSQSLLQLRRERFPEDVYAQALQSYTKKDSNTAIAQAVVDFFQKSEFVA